MIHTKPLDIKTECRYIKHALDTLISAKAGGVDPITMLGKTFNNKHTMENWYTKTTTAQPSTNIERHK